MTLVMVLSLVPQTAYASGGEAAVPQAAAAVNEPKAAKTGTVLAFTSDTHNKSGNQAANRLGTWLDAMADIYGGIDAMAFGGDMADASASESNYWTLTQADMTQLTNRSVPGIYTTGNHEWNPGNYGSTSSSLKQEFKIGAEGINGSNYRIYCLGSASSSQSYSESQISALTTYLSGVGNDKPIFIITHFPLHYYSSGGGGGWWMNDRSTGNASGLIDALNNAAAAGKKIVFLWGHNHTLSDTYYDEIYAPGYELEYASGSRKAIQFYYGGAGCMSDSEYSGAANTGSAFVKGKGLIVTIDSQNKLTFSYRNESGTEIYRYTEADPVAVTGVSVSPKTATIEARKTVKLSAAVTPEDATNTAVTWSSSNTAAATVDSSGNVKGVAAGTAVITATTADGGFTDTATVTVTPSTSTGIEYVLTDKLEAGMEYLIANGNTGNVYLVSAESAGSRQLRGVPATVDGSTITITDDEAELTVFTCYLESSNDPNSTRLKIGTQDLYTNNADGLRMFTMTDNEAGKHWHYRGDGKDLLWFFKDTEDPTGLGYNDTSQTYKYYLECSSGIFTDNHVSTTSLANSQNLPKMYLFTRAVDATGVSLNKSSVTIEAGLTETLTATVSPENATNKNVTWTTSNASVATVVDGVVTAVAPGSAVITVTTEDGGHKASCTVTVAAAVMVTYVQADTLEAGKEYLIANGNTGNVYLVSNEAGSEARQLKGVAAAVEDGKITITKSTAAKTLFTCYLENSSNADSTRLKIGNQDLYTNNANGLRMFTMTSEEANKHWHYRADRNLLWFFKDDGTNTGYTDTSQTYKYYLECSSGIFTDNHVSTTSLANSQNLPKMYLFTEGTHVHVWGEPVWSWTGEVQKRAAVTASAAFTCTECGETVTADAEVTQSTEAGRTKYTAALVGPDGKTYSDIMYEKEEVTGNFTFTVTADKEYAAPGDEVTFTITLGPVDHLGSLEFEIGIPEGLSFVADSGSLADNLEQTLGFTNLKFIQDSAVGGAYLISGAAVNKDYASESDTLIATFKCKVDPGWTGTKEVDLKNLEIYSINYQDYTSAYSTVPAAVTVEALTVTFNANEGSGTMAAQTVYRGAETELTANAFTREGYAFDGWNTKADGSGTPYADKSKVTLTENLALYAQWTKNAFNVTFVDEDGETVLKEAAAYAYGTAWADVVKPADPEKTGYTFAGWVNAPETITEDVVVKASYKVNQYTITFDTDGGTEIAAITQDYGTAVTAPADPTKEGYTFAGWDKEIPAVMPAENITVKAKWTINQYTITFDTDGGSAIAAITQDYGTAVTAPADPTKEGYTFAGWDKEIPATMPAENITVTAQWTPIEYTITYIPNGGAMPADAISKYTVESDTVTLPTPEREGYGFGGWFEDENLSGTAITQIVKGSTGDKVFYAKWVPGAYTITYVMDGGTNAETNPTSYTVETETITLADATKAGYNFGGWYLDAEFTEKVTQIVKGTTGNITLYAKFTIIEYTISYVLNGGTNAETNPASYTVETETITLADAARAGYSFDGWYSNAEFKEKVTRIAKGTTGDITLYAKWELINYPITYKLAGGALAEGEENPAVYTILTDDFTLINPTKTGYSFAGWTGTDLDEATVTVTVKKGSMGSREYTATWTINRYTITFDTAGGTEIAAITQDYGTAVTAPADPTREGYTFAGWDKEIPATMPAADITITAQWTPVEYTITYVPNGGTMPADAVTKYTVESDAITLPTPTKEGFTFGGWFEKEDLSGSAVTQIAKGSTGNKVFYAKWTPNADTAYTVDYYFETVAGGTFAVDPDMTEKLSGTTGEEVEAAVLTVEGFTFDEDNPANVLKGTIAADGSLELKVYYTRNSYKLTWIIDSLKMDVSYKFGETVNKLSDPVKEGYTFTGWDVTVPDTMPAEDLTITALWIAIEYTITYNPNGGTLPEGMVTKYTAESATITLPTPTREGYTFSGWYDNADFSGTAVTEIPAGSVGNREFWAKWTASGDTVYTVEHYFEDLEGKFVLDAAKTQELSGETGSEVTANALTAAGFTFDEANTANVLKGTIAADGSLVLKAYYTRNSYKLTWNVDGALTEANYKFGAAVVKIADPAKEAYTFAGWDPEVPETMPAEDLTLTATWEAVRYTITYVLDGGTNAETNPAEYTVETETIKLADPTKEGAVFDGWFSDEQFTKPVAEIAKGSTGNITLYAKWVSSTYKVNFEMNGHGTAPAEQTIAYKGTVTKPADPAEEGYTFGGWFTDAACTKAYDFAAPVTGDFTLYAKWTANSYTVEFNKNDAAAVGTMADQTFTYDAKQALTANAFTKDGFFFAGWALTADGEVKYADQEEVVNLTAEAGGKVTLYAVWERLTYELNKTFTLIPVNSTEQLLLIGSDGSYGRGTWTSSNESVATVDENGVVTAHKYNSDTIIIHVVMDNGYEADCEVQTLFSDVAESNKYYYKAVYWGADHEPFAITKGYNLEYFGVGMGCQRKDFILFLWRLAGQPSVSSKDIQAMREAFSDMTDSALSSNFIKAIAWGYKASDPANRIINGYTTGELAGTFGPERTITRKEAILMIWRFAGRPASESTPKFEAFDEIRNNRYKPTSDTYKSIRWAAATGLSNGYQRASSLPPGIDIPTPCYGSDLVCLREDMIVFLYRYAQYFLGED